MNRTTLISAAIQEKVSSLLLAVIISAVFAAVLISHYCFQPDSFQMYKTLETSAELKVCEIKSKIVQDIIDNEVLPYANTHTRDFKNMYFYIDLTDEGKEGKWLWLYGTDIHNSDIRLTSNDGWFECGNYQFVVSRSARKYFRYKRGERHTFDYTYNKNLSICTYDPPTWAMVMEKDKYHIAFLPYNPNTELKDKAPKP